MASKEELLAKLSECVVEMEDEEVVEVAKELKKLNNDFNIVHIYGPYDVLCFKREFVGYRIL